MNAVIKSIMKFGLLALLTIPSFALGEPSAYDKTIAEIKEDLGQVPTFFKSFPAAALPGAWEEFKAFELSANTALLPKTKELIGLAVAAQIPCRYCSYFHKKGAINNGASKEEMEMAVALAAFVRKWSTYFSGSQTDLNGFKAEADLMTMNVKMQRDREKEGRPSGVVDMKVTDAKSAYEDMKNRFGFTPNFIKAYPEMAIAGAWNELKALRMDPQSPLAIKNRDLISVAVASQVPCQYCTYIDTSFAKLHGASTAEIQEAIAVAGLVRHWSTVLNGNQIDERTFMRETDQIFKYMEAKERRKISSAKR